MGKGSPSPSCKSKYRASVSRGLWTWVELWGLMQWRVALLCWAGGRPLIKLPDRPWVLSWGKRQTLAPSSSWESCHRLAWCCSWSPWLPREQVCLILRGAGSCPPRWPAQTAAQAGVSPMGYKMAGWPDGLQGLLRATDPGSLQSGVSPQMP